MAYWSASGLEKVSLQAGFEQEYGCTQNESDQHLHVQSRSIRKSAPFHPYAYEHA